MRPRRAARSGAPCLQQRAPTRALSGGCALRQSAGIARGTGPREWSRPRQDVNPHCQAALLARGGGAESCVFGDLTERAPAARVVEGLPWLTAGRLVLASTECQSAWCAKHGALCKARPAEVEVAGPTCTDFSPEGKRRGVDGPTMAVFWAWARLQRANPALRVIVFENVPEFPVWLLEACFADEFHLHPFLLAPALVGFSLIRRERLYVLMVHKTRAELRHCPYDLLEGLTREMSGERTRPRDIVRADPEEVAAEAQGLWSRRRGRLRPPRAHRNSGAPGAHQLLNAREQAAVAWCDEEYWQKYRQDPRNDPDLFYFLGDNPWARRCFSAQGVLPTLRTNAGLLWSPSLARWLTARERMACMGYPVYPDLAEAAGVPEWRPPPGAPVHQLVGNAMHTAVVTLALVLALCCTRPV